MGNPIQASVSTSCSDFIRAARREGILENIAGPIQRLRVKCPQTGTVVKKGTECADRSLLVGNNKDMELHIQKLEQYLKQNPNDIAVRAQLAKLREVFHKG